MTMGVTSSCVWPGKPPDFKEDDMFDFSVGFIDAPHLIGR